jgi:hypothetical protein
LTLAVIPELDSLKLGRGYFKKLAKRPDNFLTDFQLIWCGNVFLEGTIKGLKQHKLIKYV